MFKLLPLLIAAAVLEAGGDALTRIGLHGRGWMAALGALTLAAYGVVVNLSGLDFGRLMGAYIAVFYAVSQSIAFAMSHELPARNAAIGGLLVIAGGILMIG